MDSHYLVHSTDLNKGKIRKMFTKCSWIVLGFLLFVVFSWKSMGFGTGILITGGTGSGGWECLPGGRAQWQKKHERIKKTNAPPSPVIRKKDELQMLGFLFFPICCVILLFFVVVLWFLSISISYHRSSFYRGRGCNTKSEWIIGLLRRIYVVFLN